MGRELGIHHCATGNAHVLLSPPHSLLSSLVTCACDLHLLSLHSHQVEQRTRTWVPLTHPHTDIPRLVRLHQNLPLFLVSYLIRPSLTLLPSSPGSIPSSPPLSLFLHPTHSCFFYLLASKSHPSHLIPPLLSSHHVPLFLNISSSSLLSRSRSSNSRVLEPGIEVQYGLTDVCLWLFFRYLPKPFFLSFILSMTFTKKNHLKHTKRHYHEKPFSRVI